MVEKSSVASRFSAIRLLTDINRMMDGTGEEILGIRRKIERRVPSKDVDQIQFYLDWALISIQGSILDKYPMRSVEYSSSPLPFYVRVLSNQQHSKEAPDLKMNAIIRALHVYLSLPSVPVLKYWRQVAYCIQEGEWIQKRQDWRIAMYSRTWRPLQRELYDVVNSLYSHSSVYF